MKERFPKILYVSIKYERLARCFLRLKKNLELELVNSMECFAFMISNIFMLFKKVSNMWTFLLQT